MHVAKGAAFEGCGGAAAAAAAAMRVSHRDIAAFPLAFSGRKFGASLTGKVAGRTASGT